MPDRAALEWWANRFDSLGVRRATIEEIAGYPTLRFNDPEGQRLALVAGSSDAGFVPWRRSPVPIEHQIRGLNHVTLAVDRLAPTARVLTDVLNFRQSGDYPSSDNPALRTVVFESGPGGPGTEVRVKERPDLPPAQLGSGGVHHVAFRAPNDTEHRAWRDRVRAAGIGITDVIDRYYFKSLYFREPGRILFEIAGVREEVAQEALRRAAFKLPVKTRILARETPGVGATAETAEAQLVEQAEQAETEVITAGD